MKILKNCETGTIMAITDSQSDSSTVTAELEIEKIISNSCGLARYSGRAVFIPFTVPGETVLAEIDLSGKKFLEGKLLKILTSSPDRVDPPCSLYGKCGGCSLQHISYDKQLEIKIELVKEALRRNGGIIIDDPEIISGSPYSYRCRVQLHPSDNGAPGFMERKGSSVVPVEYCPVCNDGINSFLSSGEGRSIKERTAVFSPDSLTSYLSSDKNMEISVKLNDYRIKTSASSFFQSNIPLFEKAVTSIKSYSRGETLLDLYAGAAVFGTLMSDSFSRIISVEEDSLALQYGKKNIPDRSGLKKDFYPVSVERFIKKDRMRIKPDTVIADPPRTGLSKQVRRYLKSIRPEVLIYLSCDYTTMARDMGDLTEKSYNIDMIRIYDFYPQTAHAETLTVLKRK